MQSAVNTWATTRDLKGVNTIGLLISIEHLGLGQWLSVRLNKISKILLIFGLIPINELHSASIRRSQ